MPDHSTKTALITGTSSGIGAACVEALAAEGWRVYAGVRDLDDAKETDRVMPIVIDVTSGRSIAAAAKRVRHETGGGLDALINNAGIPGGGPVETLPLKTFKSVIDVNLTGHFAVTQAFLPQVREAEGRIVFISSLGGRVSFPYASAYHASKWGVEGLAESLRAEMVPFDVDVVIVEPASMGSAIWSKGQDSLKESRERMNAEQTEAYGDALDTFEKQLSSQEDSEDPSKVADKVLEALNADRPSLRYLVGRGAGTLTTLKSVLPPSVFDRLTQTLAGRA